MIMSREDFIRTWTDRYVIGDRCPCDDCSSDVKMRTFAVVVSVPVVVAIVASVVAPRKVSTPATLASAVAWYWFVRPMFDEINAQMPDYCPNLGNTAERM
jgi:hypothetical protein